jgi:hypothetical protein
MPLRIMECTGKLWQYDLLCLASDPDEMNCTDKLVQLMEEEITCKTTEPTEGTGKEGYNMTDCRMFEDFVWCTWYPDVYIQVPR